ncbi:cell cycle checkpoint protein RAD17 [Teleopsis dalmanni]|uniref:cell cycle checkpoint protein RAD17 n=1 Tax=Teleopsis dalmanni TaxID=139649 RepID=UPI0018CF68B9|nr:cell cycle checkpoint protein RAD17 [Teleopsis dalmanni]
MSGRKKTWIKSAFSEVVNKKSKSFEHPPAEKEANSNDSPNQSQIMKQLSSENVKVPALNSSNWIEHFAPNTSEDLAVHANKISDIQNWLQFCSTIKKKNPVQICLLTGPTGSGKTAAIKVLCKKNQYQLHEWINPVDQDFYCEDGNTYGVSQLDAFKDFLLRASRYKSLTDQFNKRLLLVEDFPNVLISNSEAFVSILEQYSSYGKSPLIFIVADSKSRSLNISYNLFSDEIKSKFSINHINFNPIAATFMKKAMKRFCKIMKEIPFVDKYKVPSETVIDSIIVSAQGDIRNALVNLHFSSLKGSPNVVTQQISNDKNKKKKYMLKSIGRDESTTMFHALGRVFNPKFTDEQKLLHNPEEISECFSTDPRKMLDFIHANFCLHFKSIDHLVTATNGISLADVIVNEYRDTSLAQLAVNVGVRSVMVANSTPANGWMPIRGAKKLNNSPFHLDDKQSEMLGTIKYISKALYATDFHTYIKFLQSKN